MNDTCRRHVVKHGGLDEWFTATESDAADDAEWAVGALARSHSWPVLVNLADEGGSAERWWEIADAVNGDGTLPGGTGLDRTYPANTGCNRFWPAGSIPPHASLP